MKFQDAYKEMLEGKKIRRPCFYGYWYIDKKFNVAVIKLKNGNILYNSSDNLYLTLSNVVADDWEIIE